MARDRGLEELIWEHLGRRPGLHAKPMFGGLAWMLNGHLLCGAREDMMMVRLGKGNDAWALALDDVETLAAGARKMPGWVAAGPDTIADDDLRARLLDEALSFVLALPPKEPEPPG